MRLVVIVCCWVGVSSAGYTPSPPGVRPPCAERGATFCESVDQYPTKVIQNLLHSKSPTMEDYFRDEREGLDQPPDYVLHEEMPDHYRGRKGRSAPSKGRRCPVTEKEVLPKMATNRNGEWRFIVQDQQGRATQKIQVQMCKNSKECKKQCIQLYAPVAMVSLDASGNASKDTFWMPSSCHCQNTQLNTK